MRCIILVVLITSSLYAQSDVVLETKVDKSVITIGDSIVYSILIKYKEGIELQLPGLGANLGQFEIKDYNIETGKNFKRLVWTISTFFTGDFEIPSLELQYKTKDGTVKNVKTSPIKITVKSVIRSISETNDIKDIKSPLIIKGKFPVWIYAFLIFCAMSLASYSLYQKYKGVPIENIFQPEEPTRPADEIASIEITNLENSMLISEGRIKEFYIIISEIIRKYIHNRWTISTMERTTEEILHDIKLLNLVDIIYNLFKNFFGDCDIVKFAKYKPTAAELKSIIPKAKELINLTKETKQ